MAVSPITVQTIAQDLPYGYSISLSKLFTTTTAAGLPITEYMFSDTGPAKISLNGATNIATAAQTAQGEIVVAASDLSKLTIAATATSGIADLYVSAFDGTNWSVATGEALTVTTLPSAVSATPGLIMQAGSSIAATSLFTVSGYLDPNPNDTTYTFDPAPTAGVINGNGAYNESDGTYPGTFKVKGSEVNFLTYQAPTTPGNYNFIINVLSGNSGQPWSDWEQVNVTVTGPATTAAVEIVNAAANQPLLAAFVSDSAANVFAVLDKLQANLSAGILDGITLTDSGTPVEQVTAAQFLQDRGAIVLISGTYSLSITGMTAAEAISLVAPASLTHLTSVTVSDTGANIVGDLDALQAVASADHLTALIATDSTPSTVDVTLTQLKADSAVVPLLSGLFLAVSGSAADVSASLDTLQTLAANGVLGSVSLSDGGTPALTLSASQMSADTKALADIGGNYTVTVAAGSSAVNITGLSGHATTVQFSGDVNQYTVSAANGVVTVTLGTVTDHLSGITALQFADYTEIVAQAPGQGTVTSGNITELYGAVLGREPDGAGLVFYENYLKANPNTPLLQFAEWFLLSSEYSSNPAHSYAESTAGDTQFIEDSYQNLLHRTPDASEVSFYETKVLAPAVSGLVAGTQAYAAAQLQAHALMLVYFSASPEFLSDVQITASNPASAQHWLLLA